MRQNPFSYPKHTHLYYQEKHSVPVQQYKPPSQEQQIDLRAQTIVAQPVSSQIPSFQPKNIFAQFFLPQGETPTQLPDFQNQNQDMNRSISKNCFYFDEQLRYDNDQENDILDQKIINEATNYNRYPHLNLKVDSVYKIGQPQINADLGIPCVLQLKVKFLQIQNPVNRNGIDLICVVDNSSFSSGLILLQIKESIKKLIQFVTPFDRICLIQYNEKPHLLLPLKKIVSIAEIEKQVDQLSSVNMSQINFEKAIRLALQVCDQRRYTRNHIFMYHFNATSLPLQQLEEVQKLMKIFDREFYFSVLNLGFNIQNQDYLINLTKKFKGTYLNYDHADQLDYYFFESLKGFAQIAFEQAQIKIQSTGALGGEISQTYGNRWIPVKNRQEYLIKIPIVPSFCDATFQFDLIIKKQSWPIIQRELSVAQVEIQMKDVYSGKQAQVKCSLNLKFDQNPQVVDQHSFQQDIARSYYFNLFLTKLRQAMAEKYIHGQEPEAKAIIKQIKKDLNRSQKIQAVCSDLIEMLSKYYDK